MLQCYRVHLNSISMARPVGTCNGLNGGPDFPAAGFAPMEQGLVGSLWRYKPSAPTEPWYYG